MTFVPKFVIAVFPCEATIRGKIYSFNNTANALKNDSTRIMIMTELIPGFEEDSLIPNKLIDKFSSFFVGAFVAI